MRHDRLCLDLDQSHKAGVRSRNASVAVGVVKVKITVPFLDPRPRLARLQLRPGRRTATLRGLVGHGRVPEGA